MEYGSTHRSWQHLTEYLTEQKISPGRSAMLRTLEDFWRGRLEETQAHYHAVRDWYRTMLEEQPEGTPLDPHNAIAFARQAESEAFAEYKRVLRAFTDLIVHGKIPEDRSGPASDGI